VSASVGEFEMGSTDESGSLNKSLKLEAAGDSCRWQVSVFGLGHD